MLFCQGHGSSCAGRSGTTHRTVTRQGAMMTPPGRVETQKLPGKSCINNTSLKINMEPENTPLQKGKSSNSPFSGSISLGVQKSCYQSCLANKSSVARSWPRTSSMPAAALGNILMDTLARPIVNPKVVTSQFP